MVPDTEVHSSHRQTSHRWVDLTLGISAMIVSVVSLAIAVRHGATMERMAEANARLVAANSWPFLQYSTGNRADDGTPLIRLKVVNVGVGPARIESLEVSWRDVPVASAAALLAACCGLNAAPGPPLALHQNLLAGRILRAGDAVTFLEVPPSRDAAAIWDRLDRERLHIKFRACFCSVFDECWLSTLVGTHATRVADCPVSKVPFGIPGAEDLER